MSSLGYAHALATDGFFGGTYQLASRGYVDLGLLRLPTQVGEPVVFLSVLGPPGSVLADLQVSPALRPSVSNVNRNPGPPPPSAISPPATAVLTVPFLSSGYQLPSTTPTVPIVSVRTTTSTASVSARPVTKPPADSTGTLAAPTATVTADRTVSLTATAAPAPRPSETIQGARVTVSVRPQDAVTLAATASPKPRPSGTVENAPQAISVAPQPNSPRGPGVTVTVLDDDA